MPRYDYRCLKCGDTFEVRQKFSDPELKVHEACGGPLEQLISAPALQFKGTGWYVTDYARGGKPLPASSNGSNGSADKKDETSAKPAGETKSESKPAPAKT